MTLQDTLLTYFAELRTRIRALRTAGKPISEGAVAQRAGMAPRSLSHLMNKGRDAHVSTLVRLENAVVALAGPEAALDVHPLSR